MTYQKLGRTNLTVSRICLGTMHFGTRATEEESFRIMDLALESGLNFFDTADVYGGAGGFGLSERIIGRWLATGAGRREKVVLATKVYADQGSGGWPNTESGVSAYKVRGAVRGSLERLGTDRIDLYQVHHIDRRVALEEFWGTFDHLQDRGEVLYIGTSNFPGWGLARFQQAALARGRLGIASEQHMYSLLCRWAELEVLPAAEALGIGVLPYMPLAGGLLGGNRRPQAGARTTEVSREYGVALEDNELLDAYTRLCREIGEPEPIVAIAWVLTRRAVTSAIVGVRSVEQLRGVLRAAEVKLDPAVITRLDELFAIQAGRQLRNGKASPEAYAW